MFRVYDSDRPLWAQFRDQDPTPDKILRHFEIRTPPVPIIDIATAMGIEVYKADMQAYGLVRKDEMDESASIVVRRGDPSTRTRFTIAHEIGHLMLHKFDTIHRDGPISEVELTDQEREANTFAAKLLMPEALVRMVGRIVGFNAYKVGEIFGVSSTAMELRFKELNVFFRE